MLHVTWPFAWTASTVVTKQGASTITGGSITGASG